VRVNIYTTTGDTAGFGLHWDDHEVLVVQIAGEKSWQVRGASRVAPMFRDSERNDTPPEHIVSEGTMVAGDVMHIPRGYWHCATRVGQGAGGHSTHMTFGFPRRTGASWLGWLAEWCRDDEVFRHNLHREDSPREQEQQARELSEAARKLIAARGPSLYLDRIDVSQGQVEIVSSGLRLGIAAEAEPAARMLLSGHPVHLAPEDPAATRLDGILRGLASVFVKEGLCSVLTPELSSGYTDLVTNATP
jgi:hypothetical protein